MRPHLRQWLVIIMVSVVAGCSTAPTIPTVATVDLTRFMGDWYVIASIPTVFEKEAFNAIENYRLNEDGTVETTFRFNKGGFDGPEKIYRSKAYVLDQTNAHWGMQFVWPFKAEYRVIYLTEDYSRTMIGRSKRDYIWIMARDRSIPDDEYERLLDLLETYGYDRHKVLKVPQQPPGTSAAG